MNMLIGRPWSVRPTSTTRTRSLAASIAPVYAYSLRSLVYDAPLICSNCVRSEAPGPTPHCGFVVPKTGSEYGCSVAPNRARTRQRKRSPRTKPDSANVGASGLTVRVGSQSPTIWAAPVG